MINLHISCNRCLFEPRKLRPATDLFGESSGSFGVSSRDTGGCNTTPFRKKLSRNGNNGHRGTTKFTMDDIANKR